MCSLISILSRFRRAYVAVAIPSIPCPLYLEQCIYMYGECITYMKYAIELAHMTVRVKGFQILLSTSVYSFPYKYKVRSTVLSSHLWNQKSIS